MSDTIREQNKRLSLLFSETDSAYHEAALKLGLTDSVMTVLYILCLFGGACPLGRIAQLSGLPKQTVNSALRRLEGDGAVRLEQVDGRKKLARLTSLGRELCEGTALRIMRAEDEILGAWSPQEREQYLSLTKRYLEDLREKVRGL